ncbi:MAG: hypothetical protein HQL30_07060 [Candidatus Omnitrophica bacterium]|nr:hypothetical protein [Candidatus Omnitrophota bacterium]
MLKRAIFASLAAGVMLILTGCAAISPIAQLAGTVVKTAGSVTGTALSTAGKVGAAAIGAAGPAAKAGVAAAPFFL